MAVALSRKRAEFIDHAYIEDLLAETRSPERAEVRDILTKAREAKGLDPVEAARLLRVTEPDLLEEMFASARLVKEKIYGKRIVLFAPLYLSNYCINNCRYCGYRRDNHFPRRRLTQEEIAEEVRTLEAMGHKRLALETGEDPANCPLDYVLESIATVYAVREGLGNIRRVNVNIAATSVANYRRLKAAGIGTYILFQETYHRPTYRQMHPAGPKSDYDWHATAMHRAMEGGIDDVGLGVLFGLYDYRFEVLALLLHAQELERAFGVGPHTISVPRLRPALGVDINQFPYLVGDADFRKIVAILRLAVPYTGMILSTRERPGYRDEIIALGISQISAGSCTGVGAYSARKKGQRPHEDTEGAGTATQECAGVQFAVDDHRSPDQVIRSLCEAGYIPSYCTACYRSQRTGDRFMALAKTGEIQNVCQPNAILTFKEYLLDYASPATREVGEQTIQRHLLEIKSPAVREKTIERLHQIEAGKRDLYF